MTHNMRLPDHAELEPPLTELPRLRELSRLERPSRTVRRFVYTRAQHTLNASASSIRPRPRARTWALSLAVVVAVPSALAATPAGALVVQHTMEWATRVWAIVDSAIALKDTEQADPAHPARQAPLSTPINELGEPPPAALTLTPPSVQPATTAPSAPASKDAEGARTPGGSASSSLAVAPSAQPTASVYLDSRAPEPSSTLPAERRMLEAARSRLRAGDASGALMLTTRHAERFPNGILMTERHAIINQVHQLQSQTR